MRALSGSNKDRKGIAVILTTLSMLTIVPMVGLGIDVSTLYIVRAKMYEAADAAALAGARGLGQGPDIGTQTSNAQAAATKFFNANFQAAFSDCMRRFPANCQRRYTANPVPWSNPQIRNVQPMPCHSPPTAMVIIRLI